MHIGETPHIKAWSPEEVSTAEAAPQSAAPQAGAGNEDAELAEVAKRALKAQGIEEPDQASVDAYVRWVNRRREEALAWAGTDKGPIALKQIVETISGIPGVPPAVTLGAAVAELFRSLDEGRERGDTTEAIKWEFNVNCLRVAGELSKVLVQAPGLEAHLRGFEPVAEILSMGIEEMTKLRPSRLSRNVDS
jgi:hypothetical protein